MLLWGSLCHHVKREASQLHPIYALPARVKPGWPLAALTLAMGLIFCTLTNVTTAAVLDAAGARVQASASGDRV